jgi:hypothetical protein
VLARFDDEAETEADASSSSWTPGNPPGRRTYRVPWADLLGKVLAVDVLAGPCGGGFGSSPSSPGRRWRSPSSTTSASTPGDPRPPAPGRRPTRSTPARARTAPTWPSRTRMALAGQAQPRPGAGRRPLAETHAASQPSAEVGGRCRKTPVSDLERRVASPGRLTEC